MRLFFYDLFILCFEFGAWLLSPFNPKARSWLRGRVNWAGKLQQQIDTSGILANGRPVVWLHASSLGEFEQGRPLIEALKEQHPGINCVVTFFSPSGYEVRKHFKDAEIVCYLPTDTPANAIRFVNMIHPSLVLWVKYEYWYHHLKALHKRKIPVLLVSGIFLEQQVFFKWYGNFHKKMLCYFSHFFVQNDESAKLLENLLQETGDQAVNEKITISGDTRFDRVVDIAENWQPVVPLEKWLKADDKVLVAGSTWPADEEELVHFVRANRDIKLVLAPHRVEPEILKDTLSLFTGALLFSDLLSDNFPENYGNSNVLILNNVGFLSRIYRYATVCYIGGGFSGTGVHNVLEAAVYGKPVVHGPEFDRYAEAVELVAEGGSFVADNALDLEKKLSLLFSDNIIYKRAANTARNFVYNHQGSTQKIVDYIQEKRLLTSL